MTRVDSHRLAGLAAAWIVAFAACVMLGALRVPLTDVLGVFDVEVNSLGRAVVLNIRLPRVLLATLVGGSLAVAGASLQSVFRNPLADPALIGVSSGAAVGVVGWIVFGSAVAGVTGATLLQSDWFFPVAAFGGGLIATQIVMTLSRQGPLIDVPTMLLAGIAVNALAGALIGVAIFASDEEQLRTLTMWTLGSLGGATWHVVSIVFLLSIGPLAWLVVQARKLDLILLGEREAGHLGVDVDQLNRRVVVACALLVGASVGFTGLIGFVGLVVPHLLRLVGGPHNRWVIPGSFLLGALTLSVSDLVSRTVVAPAELPIGVVTALFGSPFFLYLIRRSKHGASL